MTDAGPRKGLWELMGQKRSTDDPAPPPPASEEAAASEVPAAEEAPSPPAADPQPLDLSETLPDVKPRGRSLWTLMRHGSKAAPAAKAPEPPASLAPDGMRSAFEAPVKGA